jgi:hypothetical protein
MLFIILFLYSVFAEHVIQHKYATSTGYQGMVELRDWTKNDTIVKPCESISSCYNIVCTEFNRNNHYGNLKNITYFPLRHHCEQKRQSIESARPDAKVETTNGLEFYVRDSDNNLIEEGYCWGYSYCLADFCNKTNLPQVYRIDVRVQFGDSIDCI